MTQPARLGRSTPDQRRADIVRKASHLFLGEGFAATSMSTVARAIGGSKATLYRYFPTKAALFAAVLEARSAAFLGKIHSAAISGATPRVFLSSVGLHLLEGIYHADAISLSRVVVGDCGRSPEIGRVFFELGPDRTKALIVDRLLEYARAGLLHVGSAEEAAEDFFALLRGEAHFRVLAGARAVPDDDEVIYHVARVVDMLLRLWSNAAAGDSSKVFRD